MAVTVSLEGDGAFEMPGAVTLSMVNDVQAPSPEEMLEMFKNGHEFKTVNFSRPKRQGKSSGRRRSRNNSPLRPRGGRRTERQA